MVYHAERCGCQTRIFVAVSAKNSKRACSELGLMHIYNAECLVYGPYLFLRIFLFNAAV
jgi:hypothetical protein